MKVNHGYINQTKEDYMFTMYLRHYASKFAVRLGLLPIARAMNNGHWFGDGSNGDLISCKWCGLESAYWDEVSCDGWLEYLSNRKEDQR